MAVGLRYFNVFGPREAHKDKYASMIWQLSLQMQAGRRPRIFEFGEQYRDHIYVKDVVDANLLAVSRRPRASTTSAPAARPTFNEIVAALNAALGTSRRARLFQEPVLVLSERDAGRSGARRARRSASRVAVDGRAKDLGLHRRRRRSPRRSRPDMASLREIRRKIKSVKSTEQITKAMKMVAAARMRKSQLAIVAARPFAVEDGAARARARALQEREDGASGRRVDLHPFFERRSDRRARERAARHRRGRQGPVRRLQRNVLRPRSTGSARARAARPAASSSAARAATSSIACAATTSRSSRSWSASSRRSASRTPSFSARP